MILAVLNLNRSYGEVHDRVRFVGHDGVFEVTFFVENEALQLSDYKFAHNEQGYLGAFDKARSSIESVANKLYSLRRDNMIVLTRADI